MRWVIFLLVLAARAAKKVPDQSPAGTAVLPTVLEVKKPEPPPEPTADQKAKAIAFDKYLSHKLGSADTKALEESCAKKTNDNPFCYAVANQDALDTKLHERSERKEPRTRVRPNFAKKTITNWDALRADSINHLIKTFSRAGETKVSLAKSLSLAETKCPNNVAIAIAATLEDGLPSDEDPGELAALYEKGGDCLTDPDDKENNLTRSGLFYFLKKDFTHASAVWKRSASIDAAKSPRPFYWLYRASVELGDHVAANAALSRLKDKFPFSFHTVIGRLRENQDPDDILTASGTDSRKRSSKVPSVNPLMEEVELLRACNLPKAASKVIDWAIVSSTDAEPEFRLYLVELKAEQNENRPAMLLLSKLLVDNPGLASRKTLGLYFPKAYFPLFEKHADGLDPYFLLAVARQESAFDPHAVSTAKAKGLLQITKGQAKSAKGNLFDPESNIRQGARLFTRLLKDTEGKVSVMLSGYNAGPRRAVEWVRRYETHDPILFIDLIPYKETRAYVALILRNYYWYHRLHNPTEARLPWVALREGEKSLWLGTGTPAVATKAH